MTRGRLLALVAVLAVLAGALVVGSRGSGAPAPAAPDPSLAAARAAADLPACPPGLTTALPGGELPCFGDGPAVAVAQAPGRPTVLNLWATWCGPCVEEVPALVAFAARAGDRVGVVGVVHEDSPESVYAFARQFGIRYPLVRDDAGDVLRHFGPGPPITVLVRADGSVAHVQVGAYADEQALVQDVADHLGVPV